MQIILVILFIYVVFSISIYFLQERILFHKQPITEKRLQEVRQNYPNAEELFLETSDNKQLHGWFLNKGKQARAPLIIYFGGNAEEVSWLLDISYKFDKWAILLMNYRGYGLSQGKPDEKKFYQDALLLYDTFSERKDVDKNNIVVMGRSLGTGVATYLASKRSVEGVILASPYDCIASVAKSTLPVTPPAFLIKHKFNSISRAPEINKNLLILIASEDQVIPVKHSKKLYDKWGGSKNIITIKNTDHNTISNSEEYWNHINMFLKSIE